MIEALVSRTFFPMTFTGCGPLCRSTSNTAKSEWPRPSADRLRVIVNMTTVRYIDSAGVACLVEALKVAKDWKLGFAFFGLNRVAKEVLELTRLIHVFEVYGTEEEAVRGPRPAPSSPAA